jgi:hypothetical protein
MSYREFNWAKAKQDFNLKTIEGSRFLTDFPIIQASFLLKATLDRARSEHFSVDRK